MINRKHQPGFTLIELMITVAIVGILAAIALPSYQNSVMKSRRGDAKSDLLGLANAMERHFTVNNTYCGAASGGCDGTPSIYDTNPQNAAYYTFDITADASTFTLTAQPEGSQADDPCGTLSLTQDGRRTTSTNADGCW